MHRDHKPYESETHTVSVGCRASGPETAYFDGTANLSTLADLEAFTAELRRLGAADDTPIANAIDLRVTLTIGGK